MEIEASTSNNGACRKELKAGFPPEAEGRSSPAAQETNLDELVTIVTREFNEWRELLVRLVSAEKKLIAGLIARTALRIGLVTLGLFFLLGLVFACGALLVGGVSQGISLLMPAGWQWLANVIAAMLVPFILLTLVYGSFLIFESRHFKES